MLGSKLSRYGILYRVITISRLNYSSLESAERWSNPFEQHHDWQVYSSTLRRTPCMSSAEFIFRLLTLPLFSWTSDEADCRLPSWYDVIWRSSVVCSLLIHCRFRLRAIYDIVVCLDVSSDTFFHRLPVVTNSWHITSDFVNLPMCISYVNHAYTILSE